MEILQPLIILFVFLYLAWKFFDVLIELIRYIHEFTSRKALEKADLVRSRLIPNYTEKLLEKHLLYYRSLPHDEQMRFIARLKAFRKEKIFIGQEGLAITEEIRTLISASAVQITFGLQEFIFPKFKVIHVYPEHYLSPRTGKHHKGDVNPRGTISLSWKHFMEGYADNQDNINLGLHEMAHAIDVSDLGSEAYDQFFSGYFEKYAQEARTELEKMKSGARSVLRDYAATNLREFFAVSVEYFFESPKLLKDHLPELYKQLCILLNQDPIDGLTHGLRSREKWLKMQKHETPLHLKKLESSSDYSSMLILFLPAAVAAIAFASDERKASSEALVSFLSFLLGFILIITFIVFLRIKRITVYSNGFEVYLPLLPFIRYRYLFGNILSLSFHEPNNSISIKYLNSHQHVREETYSLGTDRKFAMEMIDEVARQPFTVRTVGFK